MKKLLLTTALVGVAFTAAPAMAEVSLGLGGHFKGYVTWNDQDTNPGTDIRDIDIVRDTEVHFTGETTLDNGLTVGFHAEQKLNGGATSIEESYAYFAGNWGRVNFGAEDGAAYLLQVAAPSADSNIDGLRQYISTMNYTAAAVPGQYVSGVGLTTGLIGNLDYDHVASGYNDKLTYITPVFSGFQAGVSYTPDSSGYAVANGVDVDDINQELGDAWELAARYEGQFNAVRLALGAGYSRTDVERVLAVPAIGDRTDDITTWNVGGNVGFGPFNFGAAYLKSDNGDVSIGGAATSRDSDTKTWVLGADYTTGPFVIGVSYLDQEQEHGTTDLDSKRYSGGVTYTYGPGMSFRGSVHHVEHDANVAGVRDIDGTSLLLGTQIGF
jgi:outer membrane protein OmpU